MERIKNHRLLNEHFGTTATVATMAVGLGAEAYAIATNREVISSAFDRYLENPNRRALIWLAGGLLTAHVLNLLPDNIDPIHKIAERFGAK